MAKKVQKAQKNKHGNWESNKQCWRYIPAIDTIIEGSDTDTTYSPYEIIEIDKNIASKKSGEIDLAVNDLKEKLLDQKNKNKFDQDEIAILDAIGIGTEKQKVKKGRS